MAITYYSLRGPSLSSFAKLLILTRAISLVFLLGWNSSASSFILCSRAGAAVSHDNSYGYRCCIALFRYDFPALCVTTITLSPLPGYIFVMIWSVYCALCRSLPFMTTISPTLTSDSLLLRYKLCLWRNDVRF